MFPTKPPKSCQLFAGGSTATKSWPQEVCERFLSEDPQTPIAGGLAKSIARWTQRRADANYGGWTKSISHHFETMVETIVGISRGNRVISGFLNGGA